MIDICFVRVRGQTCESVARSYVRAVTASSLAAMATGGEKSRGQHKQAGPWIEVTGLAGLEGGGVRGQDLRP